MLDLDELKKLGVEQVGRTYREDRLWTVVFRDEDYIVRTSGTPQSVDSFEDYDLEGIIYENYFVPLKNKHL